MEILQGVWKQHLRPRSVVGYGVKSFLPSPPNYVTRSPGDPKNFPTYTPHLHLLHVRRLAFSHRLLFITQTLKEITVFMVSKMSPRPSDLSEIYPTSSEEPSNTSRDMRRKIAVIDGDERQRLYNYIKKADN